MPANFEGYVCRRRTWVADQDFSVYSTRRTISGSHEFTAYQLKSGLTRDKGLKVSDYLATVRAMAKRLGATEYAHDNNDVAFEKRTANDHALYYFRFLEDAKFNTMHTVYFTAAHEAKLPQLVAVRRLASQPALPATADAKECANPPWLVETFSSYARSGCQAFPSSTQRTRGHSRPKATIRRT